jgi:Leucine-rich repeat (LRR) protein
VEEDEKAAYRSAPMPLLAPASATAAAAAAASAGPSIASGNDGLSMADRDAKGLDSGISVAQGRHDLASSDGIYAAAIATEAALLEGKGGGDIRGVAGGRGGGGGKSAKGGVATISPGRGQRVPRATAPGVEYIRRRAPGMRPSWYSERFSRSDLMDQPSERSLMDVSDSGSTSNIHNHTNNNNTNGDIPPAVPTRRLPAVAEANWSIPKLRESARGRYILYALVACAVVGIAVGVGLGVSSSKNNSNGSSSSSSASGASTFAPFSQNCSSIDTTTNPNVLTQCHCTNTFSIVPKEVAAQYDVLVQSFMPSVNPNFHGNITSCSPENQALVWLASSDGSSTSSSSSSSSSDTLTQRYRLALLFVLWDGPNWKGNFGWLSSENECSWFEVVCNSQNQVTELILSNQNITGEIPLDAAFNLTSLTKLDVGLNQIEGSLSDAIGKYSTSTALNIIDITGNLINGTLPSRLSEFTALQQMHFAQNTLQGTIPTELGLLSNLNAIDLSNNNLTGVVPTEVGLLTNMETMLLFSNNLTTTLPTELGLLPKLGDFEIYSNHVHGSLPTELFRINSTIQTLDVTYNFLTGTIPTEVGHATNLGAFDVCTICVWLGSGDTYNI